MKSIALIAMLVFSVQLTYSQDSLSSEKSLLIERVKKNGKTKSHKIKSGKKITVRSGDEKSRGKVSFQNDSTLVVDSKEYLLADIDFITARTKGRTAMAVGLFPIGGAGVLIGGMATSYEGVDIIAVPTVLFGLGVGYLMHYMIWYGKKFSVADNSSGKWGMSIK